MPSDALPPSKGRFITLEGGEGVGKTTLIRGLGRLLGKRQRPFFLTHQPGGTELGKQLRQLLLNQSKITLSPKTELLLFLADKSQHIREVLLPALQTHDFVICDRYIDSTYAYQKAPFENDLTAFYGVCDFAVSELTPDLTLILDIDPRLGQERALSRNEGLDTIEQRDMSYHDKVREGFLARAKQDPKRYAVLDASMSPEKLLEETVQVLEKKGWL